MNWRISFLGILFIIISCNRKQEVIKKTSLQNRFLISAEELLHIKNNTSIKILDFRKLEDYHKEHITNAIQIWRNDIENPNYPYKGMMPNPKQIETLFSKLGIKSTDTIVVYDNNGLCEATRLWWILQNYNFSNIKILEGGLPKWKSIGGTTNNITPKYLSTSFSLPDIKPMQYYISKEEVLKNISKAILVDTRSEEEYLGKMLKKGAKKAGRIKNSKHLDWAEAIDYHGDLSLKSIAELEKVYQKLNITKNDSIILYCHSGVRSAHTTFVLTQLLNFKNVRNYDGSWTEWSHFGELPYEIE